MHLLEDSLNLPNSCFQKCADNNMLALKSSQAYNWLVLNERQKWFYLKSNPSIKQHGWEAKKSTIVKALHFRLGGKIIFSHVCLNRQSTNNNICICIKIHGK